MLYARRHVGRPLFLVAYVCIAALSMMTLAGCKKTEPEPTVSGYYSGPMRPKSEVAPAPGGRAAKPGAKGGATAGDI